MFKKQTKQIMQNDSACKKLSNSFHTSGDFCRLLITYANSLTPIRTYRTSVLIWIQTVGTLLVLPKEFLKKVILKIRRQQKHENLPSIQTVTVNSEIFARTLFSRNSSYAKFCENKTLVKWQNHSVSVN